MGVGQGVAIVGIGCWLPGRVFTPDQYWDFMLRRGDGVVEIPRERWNVDLFYEPRQRRSQEGVHRIAARAQDLRIRW
jgi:acyl transferase domain-containing protein